MISPDRQMFSREKKVIFPFILLRLFDPEGLGAGTGLGVSPVPLVPQEIVRLPLQSSYVKGGNVKSFSKSANIQKKAYLIDSFPFFSFGSIPLSRMVLKQNVSQTIPPTY
ncbi:hypothetical protein ACQCVK_14415 [Rossellomorea vietnamensis]|uniref:hypothetical protein n=1 Tax=Rossellomorea vietnamensis TaxID=218284 RepID=UPI003CFA662E